MLILDIVMLIVVIVLSRRVSQVQGRHRTVTIIPFPMSVMKNVSLTIVSQSPSVSNELESHTAFPRILVFSLIMSIHFLNSLLNPSFNPLRQ